MTLLELLHLLRQHLKLMIILPLLIALATAAYSWLVLPDEYTATVSMYVLSKSNGSESQTVTSSDLSASQMLSNDVATLIKSDRVKSTAANNVGLSSLGAFDIEVTSSTTTRVITLKVTGTNPQQTASVANSIANAADSVAQSAMDVKSVNIIDAASTPAYPSGPNRIMYTAIALLAGILLAIMIIVVRDMIDSRVRSAEEVEELLDIAIIGRIPKIK